MVAARTRGRILLMVFLGIAPGKSWLLRVREGGFLQKDCVFGRIDMPILFLLYHTFRICLSFPGLLAQNFCFRSFIRLF